MTSDDPRSIDFDYKKYSLNHVDEWVHDALNCENTTPQEIYDSIVHCVNDSLEYHKHHLTKSIELLSLLKGQPAQSSFVMSDGSDSDEPIVDASAKDWQDFWHGPEANGSWGHSDLELLAKHYTDEQLRSV